MVINPQRLIPDNWHGIYVSTEADLIFLGSKNLECLKQYWTHKENEVIDHIDAIKTQISVLDGKTVDDIRAVASEYEHPDSTWRPLAKKAEPFDAILTNCKPGATTFNLCGWCKYNGGITCLYRYHIITTYLLIPKEFNNGSGAHDYEEFNLNTPCAITNGTQELLDTCVEYLKSELAELIAKKAEICEYAKLIVEAMEKAEEKPYFTDNRPENWFKTDDEVVCFIPNYIENASKKGIFVTGKVVCGQKRSDGFVLIRVDERINADNYNDNRKIVFGSSRPEILHKWEYGYLKNHPDYLKIWIRESSVLARQTSSEMAKAFAK